MWQIQPILLRPFGRNHLQDLRIVDCKISAKASYSLIRLLQQCSSLRTLALVNANLSADHGSVLAEYITENGALQDIDLSWNYLSHWGYVLIVNACVANRKLLAINLSHNSLIQDDNTRTNNTTPLHMTLPLKKGMKRLRIAGRAHAGQAGGAATNTASKTTLSPPKSPRRASKLSPTLKVPASPRGKKGGKSPGLKPKGKRLSLAKSPSVSPIRIMPVLDPNSGKAVPKPELPNLEEEFMLQIQSGEIEMAYLMQIGMQMKLQHFNGIMAYLLTKVIRDNKMLQHFDLSTTNLPTWVIRHVVRRLKKSPSLCSLHLTDNPGLEKEGLEAELHTMLRCKPKETKNRINLSQLEIAAYKQPPTMRLRTQLTTQKRKDQFERNIARESIKVKQIMQQKRIESRVTQFPRNDDAANFIFTRHIGLKESMPGSGQWKMVTDNDDACWHCDQWTYTLVFWNKEAIGERARLSCNPLLCHSLMKEVAKINPEFTRAIRERAGSASQTSLDPFSSDDQASSRDSLVLNVQRENQHNANESNPYVYGDFTNWKPMKMTKVSEFVRELHKKYGRERGPNYEEREFHAIADEMLELNLAREKEDKIHFPRSTIGSVAEMNHAQLAFYNQIKNKRRKVIENSWKSQIEAWLEYRKPVLVDAQ